jgi:hypothetical protein
VEVIDLNPSQAATSKNVLDEINNSDSIESVEGKLSNIDKKFFKDIFKKVEPRGPHFVEQKPAPANNMDKQFPDLVEEI